MQIPLPLAHCHVKPPPPPRPPLLCRCTTRWAGWPSTSEPRCYRRGPPERPMVPEPSSGACTLRGRSVAGECRVPRGQRAERRGGDIRPGPGARGRSGLGRSPPTGTLPAPSPHLPGLLTQRSHSRYRTATSASPHLPALRFTRHPAAVVSVYPPPRLHGRNRLGGNSLLECAVFGRIAGAQAATCSSAARV